jgi:hypothetical protein
VVHGLYFVEFGAVDMDYEDEMGYKKGIFAYAVRAAKETNKQGNGMRDVRYHTRKPL